MAAPPVCLRAQDATPCFQVAAQLDCWLGALPAAPREARELGAGALGAMYEQLRVAMLHARYGL